jgi:hypothetical protein
MERPLMIKATTAATLMSISDILCQTYEQRQDASVDDHTSNLNWQRTFHVGVTGLTFSGPISHYWYGLLERLVHMINATLTSHVQLNDMTDLALKLLLDAVLFSPVAVAGYFLWRSVLERSNIRRKLHQKWWSALQASWSFWPLANIFNFGMVPLPYRVLYNNGFSLLWNAYLSNLNAKKGDVDLQTMVRRSHPEE